MISFTTALAALAAAVVALPATTTPAYDPPSSGFHLVIRSFDPALHGIALAPCHRGAAQESLCASTARWNADPSRLFSYYHKAESYNAVGSGGDLIYVLKISGGQEVPSAMKFKSSSDVIGQELMFSPGDGDGSSHVTFDEHGDMSRDGVNDKWYMCVRTTGAPMNLLVWVNGDAPTTACQHVWIQRIFV